MKAGCVFYKGEVSIITLSRLIPVFKERECVNFITKKKRTCHNNKYHCTLSNAVVLSYVRMSLQGITVHHQMHLLLLMYECHSKEPLYTTKCTWSFLCTNVTQRNHCTLLNALDLSYVRMSLKGITVHYQTQLFYLMYECHSKESLYTIKRSCSILCTNVTQRNHCTLSNAVVLSYVRMSLKGITVHYQTQLFYLMYECH